MNKENAHLYLPLVQALADGNDIQQLSCGEWMAFEDDAFIQGANNYRIKPKPAEVNIWVEDKTNFPEEISSCNAGETSRGRTVRLFREVIEPTEVNIWVEDKTNVPEEISSFNAGETSGGRTVRRFREVIEPTKP